MTKEERQKYKELTKVLPKMLKDKIKKYKFKKKDFMIWYSTKELFFDLLIGVKVKSDDKCYCTAIETIKPLWLDDLLWDLLKMETNKKEPLSLRTIGAFTVSGAELFKNETELKEWTISEFRTNSLNVHWEDAEGYWRSGLPARGKLFVEERSGYVDGQVGDSPPPCWRAQAEHIERGLRFA